MVKKQTVKSIRVENRIVKSRNDAVLFGVCYGISDYLKIDTTFLRFLFLLSGLCYGFGILMYIILAIFLPTDKHTFGYNNFSNFNKW